MTARPLRVLLVDDHQVVRDGIKALLDPVDDIEVVAEAESPDDAVAAAERFGPDAVVMDVRLAGGSGIEATREIRNRLPAIRVLMLTSFADDDALFASIMAGASGYVVKQIKGNQLVHAIRTVGHGGSLLDPAVTAAILEHVRRGNHPVDDEKLSRLSAKEDEVLALVTQGRSNRQIARELHLSEKTVKNYVSSILMKLEVARRGEAAAYLSTHRSSFGM